ncbi:MAG TPA: cytochrome c oxidase subunit 3 [Anaerolineaceae bacterium]|nr:cytochrome c oxidase subunit 3 [Anaerolineaceae bacterium]
MQPSDAIRREPSRAAQMTLLLVLAAETVFFGMLVMSYLYLRTGGSTMTAPRVTPADQVIAGLNTLILLVSAFLAERGSRAIQHADASGLTGSLLATLILGGIFVAGQVFEFNHSGMQIGDFAFGGVFFALMSFHALHVLAGMTLLGLNYARARLGDFTRERHTAVTVGTWFWFYVTAVWLVLYAVLYWV